MVFGYPMAGEISPDGNAVIGTVSALAGPGNDARLIQISAPVQQGNSGGPVLDRSGNVVGVVVGKWKGQVDLINFAVSGEAAKQFLENVGIPISQENTDIKTAYSDTADIADLARKFTVIVFCEPTEKSLASEQNLTARVRLDRCAIDPRHTEMGRYFVAWHCAGTGGPAVETRRGGIWTSVRVGDLLRRIAAQEANGTLQQKRFKAESQERRMGKFVMIAVFPLYAESGQGHIKEIERVETWGAFQKLEDCKRETNIPFGLIPPGLAWLDCVPLNINP